MATMATDNHSNSSKETYEDLDKRLATGEVSSSRESSGASASSPFQPKRRMFSSLIGMICLEPKAYDHPFPYFRRPHIIGCFSVDGKRKFHADRHQMKFFHEANLKDPKSFSNCYKRASLDLSQGVENVVRKPRSAARTEKLDFVLKWILLHKDAFEVGCPASPEKTEKNLDNLSTDFVCFRGLLTTLMCTPYERQEGWEFVAVRFRRSIYMCKLETEQKRKREDNQTQRQLDMCSWGYKFEQYVLSDNIAPDSSDRSSEKPPDEPVNECEEFCCVFRSRLAGHSVVYGAEMDGFRINNERSNEDNRDMLDLNADGVFVELKTSRTIDNKRLSSVFAQYKCLKWWAQSFLVGIPKVVCGFRNDDGIVNQLEDYPIKVLPNLGRSWMPNVCMNFLKQVLTYVHDVMTVDGDSDDELVMYNFSWDPKESEIKVLRQKNLSQSLLPDWYTKTIFAGGQNTSC